MDAGELAMRRVVTADPDESVVAAAQRMAHEGVGDLVVVQHRDGRARPIGIVTDRDLVTRVLARGTRADLELRVRDVMRAGPVTAFEDEAVEAVLCRLRVHGIRRMPVVDRTGALQGILSLDDVLIWLGEQFGGATAVFERQAAVPI